MWTIDDNVIRLRAWGTNITHRLTADTYVLGTGDTATLQLVDPSGRTAAEHALLTRDADGWAVRQLHDEHPVLGCGVRGRALRLDPGVELGIGGLTLVAESRRCTDLRGFVARLIGWSDDAAIDHAMRSLRGAAARRHPLVLCGAGDLVAVASSIHRRAFGVLAPFVVCDPRRREGKATVRSAGNIDTGMDALGQAIGGSLCVWSRRLPRDFDEVRLALRDPALDVTLIVCSESSRRALCAVDPVAIPPLTSRALEVPRIIDEYAEEIAAATCATVPLTAADREWILRNSASSLGEIDKGGRRLLAVRNHGDSTSAAAWALGMAPISLARWLGRRARVAGPRTIAT